MVGCTRDKEYDLTQGTPGSKVMYFTANPNGEAETIKVTLDPDTTKKRQNIFLEKDFSEVAIKGRMAKGNILTKNSVHRISLKSRGHSTLGGRKVWYDPDVRRINYEERGRYLGEFNDDDKIIVFTDRNEFYFTNSDANNHYDDNIERIEKWNPDKVWTAVLYDADNNNYPYIKRFVTEYARKPQGYLGDNPANRPIILTDVVYPRLQVNFGGVDAARPPLEIDVESYIGVKGVKAKGKRITTWKVASIEELEPLRQPEPTVTEAEESLEAEEDITIEDPDAGKSQQQVIDEITGQLNLFPADDDA